MHREKGHSCNLGLSSRKVNTLVGSRRRLDIFVSSLLIKLSQVLSPWTFKFGPNHVKSSCYYCYFSFV